VEERGVAKGTLLNGDTRGGEHNPKQRGKIREERRRKHSAKTKTELDIMEKKHQKKKKHKNSSFPRRYWLLGKEDAENQRPTFVVKSHDREGTYWKTGGRLEVSSRRGKNVGGESGRGRLRGGTRRVRFFQANFVGLVEQRGGARGKVPFREGV